MQDTVEKAFEMQSGADGSVGTLKFKSRRNVKEKFEADKAFDSVVSAGAALKRADECVMDHHRRIQDWCCRTIARLY